MITASAPIDPNVLDLLKIAFCCPVIEVYGLTEVAGGVCNSDENDPVIKHVGGPFPNIKFKLKDVPEMGYHGTDKPYPRGELCLLGPQIFDGYYKRPDKTSESFIEGTKWFLTGDVCVAYPNGTI